MTIQTSIRKQLLRYILGLLAFLLPVILPIGLLLSGAEQVLQPSISAYYYTEVKFLFIIILMLFGLTFILYGFASRRNQLVLIVTGVLSVLIALIPTYAPDSGSPALIGYIHAGFAVIFFALLGWVIRDTLNLPLGFPMWSKVGLYIWIVLGILIVYSLAFQSLWPPLVYILETLILWLFTFGIYIRIKISNKLAGR